LKIAQLPPQIAQPLTAGPYQLLSQRRFECSELCRLHAGQSHALVESTGGVIQFRQRFQDRDQPLHRHGQQRAVVDACEHDVSGRRVLELGQIHLFREAAYQVQQDGQQTDALPVYQHAEFETNQSCPLSSSTAAYHSWDSSSTRKG